MATVFVTVTVHNPHGDDVTVAQIPVHIPEQQPASLADWSVVDLLDELHRRLAPATDDES